MIQNLLIPYSTPELTKIRIGRNLDGGYVLAKEILNLNENVYSYGLSGEVDSISFDLDLAENHNKQIWMYDGTVSDIAVKHPNFHYFRENVYGDIVLDQIKRNGHEKETNLTLKCDVDGFEYDIIEKVDDRFFDIFAQLVLEIHDVCAETLDHIAPVIQFDKTNIEKKRVFFEKLNERYFLFDIHANNNSYLNKDNLPNMLECCYVRKDMVDNSKLFIQKEGCPIKNLHYPCSLGRTELEFNWWS